MFCDDAFVEKAVISAVEKFNERLTTGNKLALFQIQSASKVLDLTTPESSRELWRDPSLQSLRIYVYTIRIVCKNVQIFKKINVLGLAGHISVKLQELKLCSDY